MATHATDVAVARDQVPLLLSRSPISRLHRWLSWMNSRRRSSLVGSREVCRMDINASITDFLYWALLAFTL